MSDDEKRALLKALDAIMIFIDDSNTADHYHSQEKAEQKINALRKLFEVTP